MATKNFKVKNSCKGVIPFWVNDIVGKDNYKELQKGNAVSLSEVKHRGVFEFLTEVAVVEAPKETVKKKTSTKKGDK